MNHLLKPLKILRDFKVIVTVMLSIALLVNSAPITELPKIVAGSMSNRKAFLRYSLDSDMVNKITESLRVEFNDPAERQLLEETLETSIRRLNAGKPGKVTTTEELGTSLSGKTAHGDLFETLAARRDRGAYTRPNNPGVDYQRYDRATDEMIFSQAKATKNALQSARDSMVDSLEFVGKDPNIRIGQLIKGKTAFEAVIPADQFEKLKQMEMISSEGRPSENLIEQTLRAAAKDAKNAGDTAARIKAALESGKSKDILERITVRPGPVTYRELQELTSKAQNLLKRLSIVLRNPIVKGIGKVAGVASIVAAAPVMFAQVDDLDSRKINGTVSDEQADRETFAIYGTAGLSAGIGVALLMFTPAGWVGLGVAATGVLTCWLVDDACFQNLYDRVIETEQAKIAFAELRKLRGERAAHLSGFSIPPEMIVSVDERGSYELAWKNAGSPAIQLLKEIKERDFELKDTRMWVENKPTENDILQFRLIKPATNQ